MLMCCICCVCSKIIRSIQQSSRQSLLCTSTHTISVLEIGLHKDILVDRTIYNKRPQDYSHKWRQLLRRKMMVYARITLRKLPSRGRSGSEREKLGTVTSSTERVEHARALPFGKKLASCTRLVRILARLSK